MRTILCLVLCCGAGVIAWAAEERAPSPDARHGQRLFLYCAACHSIAAGEPDKVGPNLHGMIGAPAGTRGTFQYSEALKTSGLVWTDDVLDAWLKQPTALVPRTKMAFIGLAKAQDRADLLAYLKQAAR